MPNATATHIDTTTSFVIQYDTFGLPCADCATPTQKVEVHADVTVAVHADQNKPNCQLATQPRYRTQACPRCAVIHKSTKEMCKSCLSQVALF